MFACVLRVCLDLVSIFYACGISYFWCLPRLFFVCFRRTRCQTFIIKTFRLQFVCLKTKKTKRNVKGKTQDEQFSSI